MVATTIADVASRSRKPESHTYQSGERRWKSGELAARPSAADRMDRDLREMPVREAMDRTVLCIADDQLLTEIATLMVNKNLDRVPVVREGVLVGLLTREDIVRRLFGP